MAFIEDHCFNKDAILYMRKNFGKMPLQVFLRDFSDVFKKEN